MNAAVTINNAGHFGHGVASGAITTSLKNKDYMGSVWEGDGRCDDPGGK